MQLESTIDVWGHQMKGHQAARKYPKKLHYYQQVYDDYDDREKGLGEYNWKPAMFSFSLLWYCLENGEG